MPPIPPPGVQLPQFSPDQLFKMKSVQDLLADYIKAAQLVATRKMKLQEKNGYKREWELDNHVQTTREWALFKEADIKLSYKMNRIYQKLDT